MEKSVLESFINNLKAANIEGFMLRFEGGNRLVEDNTESCRVFLQNGYVLAIETKNNYGSDKGAFNVKAIPYENIDDAASLDLTTQQILDFISAEGIELTDELKKFVASHGARVAINPGYAGYGEPVDKEGKPILQNGMPRITTGTSV